MGRGKIDKSNLNSSIIDIFEKSIDKIMKIGKVKAGDKSILDIYIPVLNFLKKNSDFQFKKNEIAIIANYILQRT